MITVQVSIRCLPGVVTVLLRATTDAHGVFHLRHTLSPSVLYPPSCSTLFPSLCAWSLRYYLSSLVPFLSFLLSLFLVSLFGSPLLCFFLRTCPSDSTQVLPSLFVDSQESRLSSQFGRDITPTNFARYLAASSG